MEKKKEKTKPQIIIIMVGSLNSGKTELLYYLSKTMEHSIDSTTIKFDIDNKEINVNIITTAGQEKMQQLPSSYFRNNNGILLIFNVTDHSSFELIANFYDQIKKHYKIWKIPYLFNSKTKKEFFLRFLEINRFLYMLYICFRTRKTN